MAIFLALIISLFGTFGVYSSWAKKNKTQYLLAGSWLLILLALILFSYSIGWEIGITYFLIGFSFLPFGFVLSNIDNSVSRRKDLQRTALASVARNKLINNCWSLLVVIPITLLLSLSCSLVFSRLMPWSEVNQLSLITIIFPLTWALFVYLYLFSIKRKQMGISMGLIGISLTAVLLVI